MVYMARGRRTTVDVDGRITVEAVAFLIAVQRRPCSCDGGAPPGHHEHGARRFELDGQQVPGKVEFPCRLHQPPTRLYFIAQVGAVSFVQQLSETISEAN